MTAHRIVKLTANFRRNLEEIEAFLVEADAPQSFEALLDELTDIVIPNLERFSGVGRAFLDRPAGSIETSNGKAGLLEQLSAMTGGGELREYVLAHYLVLYAHIDGMVYLLSIRHHKQLSFDLGSHWPA